MSSLATSEGREAAQSRKERIHTTMLIELLVLMVFLAMTYAFVQKDEMGTSRLQAELEAARARVRELERTIVELKRENRELAEANKALRISLTHWIDRNGAISASEQPVVLPQATLTKMIKELENQKKMVGERQKENTELRIALAKSKGGGASLPVCTVTPGYLVNIDLNGDGSFRVAPRWNEGSADDARAVSGAVALASGRRLTTAEFNSLAGQVRAWGLKQATPCTFRANYTVNHASLVLYRKQVRTIARYFYVPVG